MIKTKKNITKGQDPWFSNIVNFAIVISMLFVLGSCASNEEPANDETATEQAGEDEETSNQPLNDEISKSGKVFYTIPSPVELSSIIKKAGAQFDKTVLNDPSKTAEYVTQSSMALNLGIYGADLSYSSIFEQTQETMNYFAAAKKIADALGITNAFAPSTITRVHDNLNNRDSLIAIISDSYWETDAYLKENKRSSVSGLVITGGWIEALYISTKLAEKSSENKEIVSRIGEQKLTLNNLIAMLNSFHDEETAETLADLKSLQEVYNGVGITYTRKPPTTDVKTKTTTLNTTSKIIITEEQLNQISEKVATIRTKIVK
ncbi:MAG TPA: hypothetical protein EYN89_07180 [Flavobacteriales bacterium]|nr:hypothetical protein [Flavobacteriales bacterium]